MDIQAAPIVQCSVCKESITITLHQMKQIESISCPDCKIQSMDVMFMDRFLDDEKNNVINFPIRKKEPIGSFEFTKRDQFSVN